MSTRTVLILGITSAVVGFAAGYALKSWRGSSDRFSVQIMNTQAAIKLDKQTGKTWLLRNGVWTPAQTNPEGFILDKNP